MREAALPYTGLTYKHDLLERYVEFDRDHHVAEIGVGTGYSCFRLAPRVDSILGVDISLSLVKLLNDAASRVPNLDFLRADVTRDDPPERYRSTMDIVFSMDTVNYIRPPERFFRYVSLLLKPGGRAFVSFPNEPDETMEGVTNFKDLESLCACIESSGLVADKILIADFTPWFEFVYKNLWFRLKKLAYREAYDGKSNPQVFDETVAFELARRGKGANPLVRIYTSFVMSLLRLGGVYRYFDDGDPYGRYVITILGKGGDGDG